ncbi:MAG: CDP-glucose 4,6-dehydratase [Polyangiaceae bacterium]|nr:CDP-glucose 4,6-dehydratase [Polyangiaceae bacterium]
MFEDVYCGKTVLVTGHTGFKGSWLSEWLCLLGAKVVGFSLKPDPTTDPCYTSPSHFDELGLREQLAEHVEGDIRDLDHITRTMAKHQPDFVFHLAAQPLVLRAYKEPYLTVETNVTGTLSLLEAARCRRTPCIMIMITTDKVYENAGWLHAYREPDKLGGHDTYSASKACAELIVSSYWHSFFRPRLREWGITVTPVRGGNVIGGGDWAEDRIVPDAIRGLTQNRPVEIRNRHATRPWQHVLELLSGYLHLGALIHRRRGSLSAAEAGARDIERTSLDELCSPFNFGPYLPSNRSVGALVQEILKHWPGTATDKSMPGAPREAGKLNLAIDKAYHTLGWQPKWTFEQAIEHTIAWYREFYAVARGQPAVVQALTQRQIRAYTEGLTYSVGD